MEYLWMFYCFLGIVGAVTGAGKKSYNFKYLIAKGYGRCNNTSRISSASLYMSSDQCNKLGGRVSPVSPGTVREGYSRCVMDWCGVNDITGDGLTPVRPGKCPPETTQARVYFNAYRIHCNNMGGIVSQDDYDNLGLWAFIKCYVDLCQTSKKTSEIYAVSNSALCPIEDRLGRLVLITNSTDCERAGGRKLADGPDVECTLIMCTLSKDCKMTQIGKEYSGQVNQTITGRQCQRWDRQEPHNHGNTNPSWFPDETVTEAENYCRNPADWAEGPFCFTLDPDVMWELCDVPFCNGAGEQILDFQLGFNHYIYIPYLHSNPNDYCMKRFGATLAHIESEQELKAINNQLMSWRNDGTTNANEIFVGGRAKDSAFTVLNIPQDIDYHASSGKCIVLSTWNKTTNDYTSYSYIIYQQNCPSYTRHFICENVHEEIQDFSVDGGTMQPGISTKGACVDSCIGNCSAVVFNQKMMECKHFSGDSGCKTGAVEAGAVYVKIKPCTSNEMLVSGLSGVTDDMMTASSTANDTSPHYAKYILADGGQTSSMWMPQNNSIGQYLQIKFTAPREIFAIITSGDRRLDSYMTMYKLNYSADCQEWKEYAFPLRSGVNKTVQGLRNALYCQCVRILPQTWNNAIAVKVEIIGRIVHQENIALNSPTYQSSQGHNSVLKGATDGLQHTDLTRHSCAITIEQTDAWWLVDLGNSFKVQRIEITKPASEEVGTWEVSLGYDFNTNNKRTAFDHFLDCVEVEGLLVGTDVFNIECSGHGRFIRILAPGFRKTLTLCEVRVFGERDLIYDFIALKKPAFQSTDASEKIASLSVDGDSHTDYLHGSCSRTLHEIAPWWAVDLVYDYIIHGLTITNTRDATTTETQLRNFVIEVDFTLVPSPQSQLCTHITNEMGPGETRRIICDYPKEREGRFIRIRRMEPGVLTFCEVQVLGKRAPVLTYGGTSKRRPCRFPFIYNGTEQNSCTTEDKARPWCMTEQDRNDTSLYQWGYCQDIRLVGGRTRSEGRVEVRQFGAGFGTICDDDWDNRDATVVCKQLGYQGGRAIYPPFFAAGRGPIMIDNVNCTGAETSFDDCPSTKGGYKNDCTHMEDAGVMCNISPDAQYQLVGYPVAARTQTESMPYSSVILAGPHSTIRHAGNIIQWFFNIAKPHIPVSFQLWRPLSEDTFQLVASTAYRQHAFGDQVIREWNFDFRALPGDMVGFTFESVTPIPFDLDPRCDDKHRVFRTYPVPTRLQSGDVYTFTRKEAFACRLFSFAVKMRVEVSPHSKEFFYKESVYRVFDEPIPLITANGYCKSMLGENSTILRIDSYTEHTVLAGELEQLHEEGGATYWVHGKYDTMGEQGTTLPWAHCQPEEGLNCIAVSNRRDSDTIVDEFSLYTKSCTDNYPVVCEVNKTISLVTPSTTLLPDLVTSDGILVPSNDTNRVEHYKQSLSNGRLAVIILFVVVVVAIGIVVIIFIVKKHTKNRGLYRATSPQVSYKPSKTADDNDSGMINPTYGLATAEEDKMVQEVMSNDPGFHNEEAGFSMGDGPGY